MTLRLEPLAVDQAPSSPPGMRAQRAGRVSAVLDGDAHLRVWEPNGGADRLDIDLTPSLAMVLDIGLDAPPAPQPHWTDGPDMMTLIVSIDVGAAGAMTVDGHLISECAAVKLAANGFVELLHSLVEQIDDAENDCIEGADDSAETACTAGPDPGENAASDDASADASG